jgi:hypothetical protein
VTAFTDDQILECIQGGVKLEQGFKMLSDSRKYAYNFGLGKVKHYSYYVAKRD